MDKITYICLITGNPGFNWCYENFLKYLELPYIILEHPGHDKNTLNTLNTLNNNSYLEFCIDYHYTKICTILEKKNNIILIGHSVGAWLIIHIYNRLKKYNYKKTKNIKQIHLLTPTICDLDKNNDKEIFLKLVKIIVQIVILFPKNIIKIILSLLFDKFTANNMIDRIDNNILNNITNLYIEEKKYIKNIPINILDTNKYFIHISKNDLYTPLTTRNKIMHKFKNYKEYDIKHDFIQYKKEYIKIAQNINKMVKYK